VGIIPGDGSDRWFRQAAGVLGEGSDRLNYSTGITQYPCLKQIANKQLQLLYASQSPLVPQAEGGTQLAPKTLGRLELSPGCNLLYMCKALPVFYLG